MHWGKSMASTGRNTGARERKEERGNDFSTVAIIIWVREDVDMGR